MSYNSKYKGSEVEAKLDSISSLATKSEVSEGLGAKADKSSLAAVATSGSYNDLTNKPTIPSAVTESTVAGWGFTKNTGTYSKPSTGIPATDLASSVQTSLGKADTALQSYTETDPVFKASAAAGITSSDITNWNGKTSNVGTITGIKMNGSSKGTSGVVDLGTVITAHQDISGKADKSSLATVATSGSYNDLSNKPTIPSEQVNADWNATSGKAQILNKPTIPSAVTESTVSGWGFTKNTGTYSKPSTGIPKTDLASAVQTSLGKADTALQSYTEQYKGTVTGVKVNGTTKNPSSGVVDIGNVVTSIKINGSTKTPSNGVVDLGTIEGGSSSGGGEKFEETTASTITIQANKCFYWKETGTSGTRTISDGLSNGETSRVIIVHTSSYSYSFPSSVVWANETAPVLGRGKTYEISFTKTAVGILGVFTYYATGGAGAGGDN